MSQDPGTGRIAWTDLTVDDAGKVRDFYSQVVGWDPVPVGMGEYDDFSMCLPGSEDAAAGICHARGLNADLPPVWIPYIVVDDLDASLGACADLGGEVVVAPRDMEPGSRYAVIRDPSGAVAALYQTGE
jgi:predicted enzyme related to lactoylglutathione lyase